MAVIKKKAQTGSTITKSRTSERLPSGNFKINTRQKTEINADGSETGERVVRTPRTLKGILHGSSPQRGKEKQTYNKSSSGEVTNTRTFKCGGKVKAKKK